LDSLEILKKYFPFDDSISIKPIDNGLINSTFEINNQGKRYILQKINTHIFKNPDAIIENHCKVNEILRQNNYPKICIDIIHNCEGDLLTKTPNGEAWRLMSFVESSQTLLKITSPKTAEKAALAFAEFYLCLNQKSVNLQEVLPNFLDFELRINDYNKALANTTIELKENAKEAIQFVEKYKELPLQWINWTKNHELPSRIIHADPKISNILFDENENAICIIDLDTLMNNTLLYDFGDMARSYTNRLQEDDASQINNFDAQVYEALKNGFLQPLQHFLEKIELENLDYAAQVVIYIQAIRFLTDYLDGSIYYSVKYENHNLDRTHNQINLLMGLQKHLRQQ
jgi:Ser/Thr protein kinase RdoA (MazF antagonist)